jgi:hypothetical protein
MPQAMLENRDGGGLGVNLQTKQPFTYLFFRFLSPLLSW